MDLLEAPHERQLEIIYGDIQLTEVDKASDHEVVLHKRLLWQKWQDYRSQAQSLSSSLDKAQAEQAAIKEVIAKLEKTLPIIAKRAATMKDLHSKNYASELDYLQVEQERIQQQHDLAAEKQRLNQSIAAEAEVTQHLHALSAQVGAAQLTELSDNQRQIAALHEELAKASDLNSKKVLYAPVAGQVQELAVATVGGVVTDAQQLMLIVPEDENLEVEVFLENKDIGFVRESMSAEIKIHTFPFTKYGLIGGTITSVSDDATVDEKRGLIYGMRLRMAKNTLLVDGNEVRLKPGMAVTAEVQTGKRKIVEFFLAPLLRHGKEGLRER